MTKLTLVTDFCCKTIQFTKKIGKSNNFAVSQYFLNQNRAFFFTFIKNAKWILSMQLYSSARCCRYTDDHYRKTPLMADPFITDICHCKFISLIIASKNACAVVFVTNYISWGGAELKAFEGTSFTHSYLSSSSIPTAQQSWSCLWHSAHGVIHDWATLKERMQLMYQLISCIL